MDEYIVPIDANAEYDDIESHFETYTRLFPTSEKLWADYLDFLRHQKSEFNDENVTDFAKVIVKARNATEWCISGSTSTWEVYKYFWREKYGEKSQEYGKVLLQGLARPFPGLSDLFSEYSMYVTSTNNDNYETLMSEANLIYQSSQAQFEERSSLEHSIARSPHNLAIWWKYIAFEHTNRIPKLLYALYNRALMYHPTDVGLWYSFLLFLKYVQTQTTDLIETFERCITFIPSNGNIWSLYVLSVDNDLLSDIFERAIDCNLEPHHLLMVQKVYMCRCYQQKTDPPYFDTRNNEDDFQIHQITINYLIDNGNISGARKIFESLKKHKHMKNNALFWQSYIKFEFNNDNKAEALKLASQNAMRFSYASELIDLVMLHGTEKDISVVMYKQQQLFIQAVLSQDQAFEVKKDNKRILDESEVNLEESFKRQRMAVSDDIDNEDKGRDREHNTVCIGKLPEVTTESQIRMFFKDCGIVNTLTKVDSGNNMVEFFLEFATHEDALSAITKDHKLFLQTNYHVRVVLLENTTLWITNFAPNTTKDELTQLFSRFGRVVEVRTPSLTINSHRRFAYIQMSSAKEASAALSLHNTVINGFDKPLIVKLSDPTKKDKRSGGVYEGREIYVSHLPFDATGDELKQVFEQFGKIESINLPFKPNGENKGFAFITFRHYDDANKASNTTDIVLKNRFLKCSIAEIRNPSRHKTGFDDEKNNHFSSRFEIRNRSIGLDGLESDVTSEQIGDLLKHIGPIKQVVLRPENGGAIVEFEKSTDAGRVSLMSQNFKLNGKIIRVVRVEELLSRKVHDQNFQDARHSQNSKIAAFMPRKVGTVKLPVGTHLINKKTTPKSNDDFRKML